MITATAPFPEELLLHVHHEIEIDAPVDVVFEAVLEQLGPGFGTQLPMPMKLEPWPGGRWFRDLGNNTGHLWGHVQVIKPPTLLEITGPLCMSYAAISHVQYRLSKESGRTRLAFTYRALGEISPEHRAGMPRGWAEGLERMRENAERRSKSAVARKS